MSPSDHPRAIREELVGLIAFLVESGLADDQNGVAFRSGDRGSVEVTWSGESAGPIVMKRLPYRDLYLALCSKRAFSAKLLDGALLQMSYRFTDGALDWHRLAYLPAPDLVELMELADAGGDDALLAELADRGAVPVPVRFDFDDRTGVAVPITHPISHLTLGEHQNCRIPVTCGVTPTAFVDLVLRAFYGGPGGPIVGLGSLPVFPLRFERSLVDGEEQLVHINPPT